MSVDLLQSTTIIILEPLTLEDIIMAPELDTVPEDTWQRYLAELDMAEGATENGTFTLAVEAGLVTEPSLMHYSPWGVE